MPTATKKAAKKSTRKYSPAAGKSVEREMKAMKEGKLKSGRSGKTVTNPSACPKPEKKARKSRLPSPSHRLAYYFGAAPVLPR